jgi:hypothetical protein
MRPYFAYASNMDIAQMAERCPGARIIDGAVLAGMKFVITAKGYANVVPDPDHTVFGILWDLPQADEESMDRYEGVRPGLYRKEEIEVVTAGGKAVRALIYRASATKTGLPAPGYLEATIAAARGHGMPAEYIAQLEGWLRPH